MSRGAPGLFEVVPDENLSDAVSVRAYSRSDLDSDPCRPSTSRCACCARASMTLRSIADRSSGVRFGWIHVDREQFPMKAIGVAPAAGQRSPLRSRGASYRPECAPVFPGTARCHEGADSASNWRSTTSAVSSNARWRSCDSLLRQQAAYPRPGGASTTTTSSAAVDKGLRDGL